jgi:hypothetical protein
MSEKKFVLVKGIGGMGNRMLSVLTAILYARISGRCLLVDWSDGVYSSDGTNVFPKLFQCPSHHPTDVIAATDSIRPKPWKGHLGEPASQLIEQSDRAVTQEIFNVDLGELDYSDELLVLVKYQAEVDRLRHHFEGRFEELGDMSAEAILSKLLREDLALQPHIRERVDHFKLSHFSPPMVGVHVRYSDYRVPLIPIVRQLNVLLKRFPGLRIFLATDNLELKGMFERNYRNVVTMPHWYPRAGMPIHLKSTHPDKYETAVESLVDMYLLAECDHLIVDTTSSFAYLATLLSKAPSSNIIRVVGGRKLIPLGARKYWQQIRTARVFSLALRVALKVVPIRRL